MDPPHPQLTVGQVLGDKYVIERQIGKGGMGVVYAARHTILGGRWAVKVLSASQLDNDKAQERFQREARNAARLGSRHAVQIVDVGTMENGLPYMVMEYLEGQDLAQLLYTRGPLPLAEAVSYLLQAAEAIEEAHGMGIVHRDLKPSNLFLVRDDRGRYSIKVLDFGTSTHIEENDPQLTAAGCLMGSPLYMSPEQIRRPMDAGPPADIWSLGVLLYELLCGSGNTPFNAGTVGEVLAGILTERPAPIQTFRSDIPPRLATAIYRCLEHDPAKRHPNVRALAEGLAPFAAAPSSGVPSRSSPHPPLALPPSIAAAGDTQVWTGEEMASMAIPTEPSSAVVSSAEASSAEASSIEIAPNTAPKQITTPGWATTMQSVTAGLRLAAIAKVVLGLAVATAGGVLLYEFSSPQEALARKAISVFALAADDVRKRVVSGYGDLAPHPNTKPDSGGAIPRPQPDAPATVRLRQDKAPMRVKTPAPDRKDADSPQPDAQPVLEPSPLSSSKQPMPETQEPASSGTAPSPPPPTYIPQTPKPKPYPKRKPSDPSANLPPVDL